MTIETSFRERRTAKLASIFHDEVAGDKERMERVKDSMRRKRVQERLGLKFQTDEGWEAYKAQEDAKIRLHAEAPYSSYRPGQRRCFADLPEEVLALIVYHAEWPAMLMRVNRTMLRVAGRIVYSSNSQPLSNPRNNGWSGAELAAPTRDKPFGGDLKRSLLGYVEHLRPRVDTWTSYEGSFLAKMPQQYTLFSNLKTLVMVGAPSGPSSRLPIRTSSIAQFCSRVSTQHACITDRLVRGLHTFVPDLRELWFANLPESFTTHGVRCTVRSDRERVVKGPVLPCYGTLNVVELSHHAGYKRREGDDETAESTVDDEDYESADHPVPTNFKFKAESTEKLVQRLCDIIIEALPELGDDEEVGPFLPEEQELRDKTTWRFVLPSWWNSTRRKGLKEPEFFQEEILRRLPSVRGRVTCCQLASNQTTECLACRIHDAEVTKSS